MGFLDISGNNIYLSINNERKPIRPLMAKPEGIWVRQIPSVRAKNEQTGKIETIRQFRMVQADNYRWLEDNPDPMWDLLDDDSKFNRQGERKDFPIRPQHILLVWSYLDNDVKVVKQGNQFYDEMGTYFDAGNDIQQCDWFAWKEGSGRFTQYKTSRNDKSEFVLPPGVDMATIQAKIPELKAQAYKDLNPFKDQDTLIRFVSGQKNQNPEIGSAPQQGQLPAASNVPSYNPGGSSVASHAASVPAPAPAPQPQQQTAPAPQPQQQTAPAPQPQQQSAPAPQQQTAPVPQQQTAPAPQPQQQTAPAPQQYIPQPQGQQPPVPQPQQQTAPAPAPQPQQTTPAPAPQQETEVPNAPVAQQPVHAPPVTVAQPQAAPAPQQQELLPNQDTGTDPGSIVVDFGKHKGKTLAFIRDNDTKYLTFLKGNKPELADAIGQLLSGQSNDSAPAQASTPQPQQASAPPASNGGGDNEEEKQKLVREINQTLMGIQEFQGPGIATKMMPFLVETVGTTDFSGAPLDKLLHLKEVLAQR